MRVKPRTKHPAAAVAAGGVEAMDWAEMLERMYLRWSGAQGFNITVSDRSEGEEAGIKSVEMAVRGRWAYGYLKGEYGQQSVGWGWVCPNRL
jgi:peptide chain release factor 2